MASNENNAKMAHDKEKSQVVLHAIAMTFGTLSSRVLGLVREMVFAAYFNRTVTDAWAAAFKLPNLFRRLLGEGSLSVSFIPVFIETRQADEAEGTAIKARNLVNSFYTLLLLVLTILTTLGIVFAGPVLDVLLDPAYSQVPGKFELTVRFARIMFGFIFLMSSYAYFMAILNALGKFALAATAPTLFNVAMIIFTVMPVSWFPVEGDGLAWGVLVGGLLQASALIPALVKRGYFPKLQWDPKNPYIWKVLRGMGGGLLGLGLMQVTTLVNMRFASQLDEGAISYIYWADRLLELPLSLVSVSLGTALLPTLAAMWSRQEPQRMSETAHFYLRLNIFVAIPAALGLYFLAYPIVDLLYQRGRFTAQDTLYTAMVVQVYALILVPTSCVRVLAPAYYAVKNTWYPAVISGVALLVHIALAPWLMKFYGLKGLVFSTFVSSSVNFVLLLGSFTWHITSFNWKLFFVQVFKFLIPGAVMALVLMGQGTLREWLPDNLIGKILHLALIMSISTGAYMAVASLLRLEESQATIERFIKKIQRKLKR